jgi:glutamate synthase (NADPH/NADH) small chain
MGNPTGFMEFDRKIPSKRPVALRVHDFDEFYENWTEDDAKSQGSRCMNCSVPFCHSGCPLGNLIPDWNDLVYQGRWKDALDALHATNNFPEFTGRICPAPCEASCVLSINQDPVAIEHIEKAISDRAWKEGWIVPNPPKIRTGKQVAIVGSGPAGLSAAQQLNYRGHSVTVFERNSSIGGLLRLGIPDFKLDKHVVDRRVDQMIQEGIVFRTDTDVGIGFSTKELMESFDAVCLTGGSTIPRDLPVKGRDLNGVHFAMDYLTHQNLLNSGHNTGTDPRITAEGKRVVILGGGDTGADCLGTAHRQGAEVVHQYELLSEPPNERNFSNPWPQWPVVLRSSPAHEEGGIRDYGILTKSFYGVKGQLAGLRGVRVEWGEPDLSGRPVMTEIPQSEFEIKTELVLLAMGFLHPKHEGLLSQLEVELDPRGNVATDENKMTNIQGVFSAGDMARGQSLVVWALAEGREAARGIDEYLMGDTTLGRVRY